MQLLLSQIILVYSVLVQSVGADSIAAAAMAGKASLAHGIGKAVAAIDNAAAVVHD